MTDLRKAAESALWSWDYFFSQAHPEIVDLMYGNDWAILAKERTEALRTALAQPENQMPTKIFGPNLEEILNSAGFYKKKEWVGLTDEEKFKIANSTSWWKEAFAIIEAKLKDKNR